MRSAPMLACAPIIQERLNPLPHGAGATLPRDPKPAQGRRLPAPSPDNPNPRIRDGLPPLPDAPPRFLA